MTDSRLSGDLNRGRLSVRLVTFGVPLVLGMFFHSLFNLVDLIIVGKLFDVDLLAAVNYATLLSFVPQLLSTGVSNASIAFISRNFGMRNYKRANAYTMQSFLLLAALALAIGWPSYVYAEWLNRLVGASGDAVAPATAYLKISSAGLITMFLLIQVTAVLRAGGNSFWPMVLLIGANTLNVFLDVALVHGLWGFPRLEVAGAAWGTVISRGVFAVFGLYLITLRTAPVRLIMRRVRLRWRMLWNLTRIGIPSSLQYVVRVVAYGAIMRFVVEFGHAPAMHAALAVGFRLDMLATFTGIGWGAAGAAIVGQALGAGNRARAERAGWLAAGMDGLLMAGFGVVFYIWAPWLVTAFTADPDEVPEAVRDPQQLALMIDLAVEYLRIAVFGYVFAGVGITLAQALNGAGSTKMPLFLDTVGFLLIQIPVAAYICFHSDQYTPSALWWSIVATTGLAAAFYAIVWNRGHWKEKKIQ